MKLLSLPESIMVYDIGPDYYDRLTIIYPDGAVFTTTLNDEEYFNYAGQFNSLNSFGNKRLFKVPSFVFAKIQRLIP